MQAGMALHIRNAETERLAVALAALTGETKTAAVTEALKERLERMARRQRGAESLADRLNEIATHCAALPVLDSRGADEMLYDWQGLPQ
jgi:antitoxin VapB